MSTFTPLVPQTHEHDMAVGPCKCGAWHSIDEQIGRNFSREYYDTHAMVYFDSTHNLDITDLHTAFLASLPASGMILDAGCGSGRDSRAFLSMGYKVVAFDESEEMAKLASKHIGQRVFVQDFMSVTEEACYDGVWASASLLHLPAAEIPRAIQRLWRALKPGGAMYMSFKYGHRHKTQRVDIHGRRFTDASEDIVNRWIDGIPDLGTRWFQISEDEMGRGNLWLNCILRRVL